MIFVSAGTICLIPGIYLARRLFRVTPCWQPETYICIFSFLGWTLGGAAMLYGVIPHFDKVVHCLSGVFVSMPALSLYLMLERGNDSSKTPSQAISSCFLLPWQQQGFLSFCELGLAPVAPVMQKELQHVADTGITDTMMDIIVCTVGTLVSVLLMMRSKKGKHDPFTDQPWPFFTKIRFSSSITPYSFRVQ